MSTYYIKGGSRFNEANPNVWLALHLAGYPSGHYLDTGWKDFNVSGANEDPYLRLGGDGGLKEVEFGLSGQQRIKINTAGIWGWHVTSGAWFSLYGSGAGGGVTDHGELDGLGDDDHSQYLNIARGDARYYKTELIFHTGELYHTGQLFTSTYIIAQYTSGNIFEDLSGDYLITSGDFVVVSGDFAAGGGGDNLGSHEAIKMLDMNTFKITGMGDPVADQDGATKKWTDDHNWTEGDITDLDTSGYEAASGDYSTTSGAISDYPTVSGDYSTHHDDVDAHHAKYTDGEAVDAVEAAGLTMANPIDMQDNLLIVGQSTDVSDPIELLKFEIERGWSFRKRGVGANTYLSLESNVSSKSFYIKRNNGSWIARFFAHDTQASNYADLYKFRVNGGAVIIDEIINNDALSTSDVKLCTVGNVKAYADTKVTQADFNVVSGDYVDTSGMVNDYPTVSGAYSTHQDNSTAHHTPPGAGDLLHNELGGLNAGDVYEHISQDQKNALHAIYTLEVHNNTKHDPNYSAEGHNHNLNDLAEKLHASLATVTADQHHVAFVQANADALYSVLAHLHDDRYYTETEIGDKVFEQSDTFPVAPSEGDLHYSEVLDSWYRYNGEAEAWVEVGVGGLVVESIDNLGNHTAEEDLDMDSNDIINVGLVDGVDISAHLHDGDTLECDEINSSANGFLIKHRGGGSLQPFTIKGGDPDDYFTVFINDNIHYICTIGGAVLHIMDTFGGNYTDVYCDIKDQASAITVDTLDKIKAVKTMPDGKVDYESMPSEIEITEEDNKKFTDVGDMMYFNMSAIKELLEKVEFLENKIKMLEEK